MNVSSVMDGLGVRLATIGGLRVFDFPPDNVPVPAGVVGFPDTLDYDATAGRGSDIGVFPVSVVVGKASDRSARDALAAYMSPNDVKSVKTAIESGRTLGGAAHSCRVMNGSARIVTIGGVDYLSALFNVQVIG